MASEMGEIDVIPDMICTTIPEAVDQPPAPGSGDPIGYGFIKHVLSRLIKYVRTLDSLLVTYTGVVANDRNKIVRRDDNGKIPGLDKVNNTADTEKPVSTAVQEAIDAALASATSRFTGEIVPFYGRPAQVPSGWLICDGTTVGPGGVYSDTKYVQIFTHMSNLKGLGLPWADSNSIPLPDLRGIFLKGAGSSIHNGVVYDGGVAGTERKASMPNHSHPYREHNNTERVDEANQTTIASDDDTQGYTGGIYQTYPDIDILPAESGTLEPRSVSVNYIIKI